jgi:hypothetical protein
MQFSISNSIVSLPPQPPRFTEIKINPAYQNYLVFAKLLIFNIKDCFAWPEF